MVDQRQAIVNEIYATEESYITKMHVCLEVYKPKLQANLSLIKQEDIDTLFEHYDEILQINEKFYSTLKSYKENGTLDKKIGTTFKMFTPFFKVYFLYISHYNSTVEILATHDKNEKFFKLIQDISKTTENLDLRSYLIMPVQRLPRYKLLLQELLKNTENTHEDYMNIKSAFEMIQNVAKEVNDRTKETEKKSAVYKVSRLIEGLDDLDLNDVPRELVKEGMLVKVCRSGNKNRFFYLFTDVMIYGVGNQHITVSEWFYNRHVVLEDDIRYQNAFSIKNDVKSFTVICDSTEEKKKWVDAINRCSNEQRKLFAGEQIITKSVYKKNECKTCVLCGGIFSMGNRKRHCAMCSKCVCANCSKGKIPLPPKNDIERVCDACFFKVTGQRMCNEIKGDEKKMDITVIGNLEFSTQNEKKTKRRKRQKSVDEQLGIKTKGRKRMDSKIEELLVSPRPIQQNNVFFDFVGESSEEKLTEQIEQGTTKSEKEVLTPNPTPTFVTPKISTTQTPKPFVQQFEIQIVTAQPLQEVKTEVNYPTKTPSPAVTMKTKDLYALIQNEIGNDANISPRSTPQQTLPSAQPQNVYDFTRKDDLVVSPLFKMSPLPPNVVHPTDQRKVKVCVNKEDRLSLIKGAPKQNVCPVDDKSSECTVFMQRKRMFENRIQVASEECKRDFCLRRSLSKL
ncbi:Rho/RAC guanine nucleotide exchange factor, putative [Entamoeba invadens IP1]|uniref:Rho/RAC guanine nucleotide exchange factor, putative n=1 Tax=Entamoeba invadens IP1 TaxID=370355 RepID=A0A0A1UDK5_ENTIV|nr:Rho/RAC guanine nucleotide exchange factor, putative [Entamoeba invadens IP1]ELP94641.1 Rho/RAC guanine nucleotide exchange factor, putative [Entamoeba invadens IP1]|eukprot:XP_004261412.1 Rho/RAC guanine nucleotide exchange factor, putative [Entamoeba invadens IP1]